MTSQGENGAIEWKDVGEAIGTASQGSEGTMSASEHGRGWCTELEGPHYQSAR